MAMRLVLVGALVAAVCLADGIPVDRKTGKLTVPFSEVQLNADQVEELQTLGTVTLTHQQWTDLRAEDASVPKRFESVLPITWNDCTCGIEFPYCIVMSKDKIAVLHHEGNDQPPNLTYETYVKIRLDEQGQFYYKGRQITLESLAKAFEAPPDDSVKSKNEQQWAYVEYPPLLEINDAMKTSAAALKERIAKTAWKVGEVAPGLGE